MKVIVSRVSCGSNGALGLVHTKSEKRSEAKRTIET